jgi:uncharacterized membrane protein
MDLPLHPKLVHVPIVLALLMPLLTGGLLVAIVRDWLPRRSWLIAVAAQAVLVVGAVFAMRSGEADEERVERRVPHAAMEQHEDAASLFTWAGVGVLALAILPLILRDPRRMRAAAAAVVLASVGVLALGYRVGAAGGELVYVHGAANAAQAPANAGGQEHERER